MKEIFGTDGVRDATNGEIINPFFINKIALAIYKVLLKDKEPISKSATVVIAKDTRRSGYMIENAVSSVLMSLGVNIILVGPVPTPALPFLIKLNKAQLGLMISASHNPHHDNGIKVFNSDGFKINKDLEKKMEKIISNNSNFKQKNLAKLLAKPENIGTLERIHNADEKYVNFLIQKLHEENSQVNLSGMKIILDCSNGSGYKTARLLFEKLNATLILINNKPDGLNINHKCGAMHPESLCLAVKKHNAALGIALDGDADRIALCDENSEIVDNDKLMAMIAIYYKKHNILKNNTLVTTILSNNSIELLLNAHDIQVYRTQVGDRYISEAMTENNFNFGGEKSGHIIFGDYSTSGDGALSGAIVSWILKSSKRTASEFFQNVELLPQVTRNISYNGENLNPEAILASQDLQNNLSLWKKVLGDGGRILVRKSGTEKKIRLMAEGSDIIKVNLILDNLSDFLNEFLV